MDVLRPGPEEYLKRLSVRQRLRLVRIAELRMDERKRKRRRAKVDGANGNEEITKSWHEITVYKRGKVRKSYARERIPMPENFCLIENYDTVAECLGELRHRFTTSAKAITKARTEGGRRKTKLRRYQRFDSYTDFASIKRITPAAALVLASEYDRILSLYNIPEWLTAINIEKWNEDVLTTLRDVGFLSLLNVEDPRELAVRGGKYIVPFLSGAKVYGAQIDKLIRTMAELAGARGIEDSERLLQMTRVYDGLGEAIQNVEDHAYPAGAFKDDRVLKKWWITGSVEPSKKRFTVVIYDHGVSIPVSLPLWRRFGEFRTAFAKTFGIDYDSKSPDHDGETISQAVQLGWTSTGKAWHGKGLPMIRDIVDNCASGTLRIFSRCGQYSYESASSKASYSSRKLPISGTLVEWDLFL